LLGQVGDLDETERFGSAAGKVAFDKVVREGLSDLLGFAWVSVGKPYLKYVAFVAGR